MGGRGIYLCWREMNEIKGLTQRIFFFRYSCSYHNLMAFSREDNNESSTETSPQQKKKCFAFLPNYFSFKSFVKRLWIKPKWPWSANLAPHNNRKKPSTGWNSSNRLDRWTWRWLAKSPSKNSPLFPKWIPTVQKQLPFWLPGQRCCGSVKEVANVLKALHV